MLSKKEKKSTKKYDFARITVELDSENSYVYSRYLLSRILTSTGVDEKESSVIAFDLKKDLVDNQVQKVSKKELLERLQLAIKRNGKYGDGSNIVENFRLMYQFHEKRIPILVLLFGTGCVGKTVMANRLGEIINVSAVLPTDVIFELERIRSVENYDGGIIKPCWFRKYESKEKFLESYREQCIEIRHGLEGDIKKCFNQGKSIVISGIDLDPMMYEEVVEKYSLVHYLRSRKKGGAISDEEMGGKGIVLSFYVKNETFEDAFFHMFGKEFRMFEIDKEVTRKNFNHIKEYLEQCNTNYHIEHFKLDRVHLNRILKKMHSIFMKTVREVVTECNLFF